MADPELSPSLEDYLEAIYNLKVRNGTARVKDIAREMGVTMPSVTGAIRSLAAKGLVKHDPYESVDLTEEGLSRARSIAHTHSALKEFLVGVLGLSEEDAEREACGMEHAIRPETLHKLLKFVDFARARGDGKSLDMDDFRHYLEQGGRPSASDSGPRRACRGACGRPGALRRGITSTRLSDLCPGMSGRIAFVSAKGPLRRKLLDMGLTPNTRFEVLRAAPFGDPIEIKVRGYYLSLRKSEAEHIEVEVDQ